MLCLCSCGFVVFGFVCACCVCVRVCMLCSCSCVHVVFVFVCMLCLCSCVYVVFVFECTSHSPALISESELAVWTPHRLAALAVLLALVCHKVVLRPVRPVTIGVRAVKPLPVFFVCHLSE